MQSLGSKWVKFEGKVLQVMEGSVTNQIRLAINVDYDKVILVEYVGLLVESIIMKLIFRIFVI